MAESCGLPSEAICALDFLVALWRMQWLGPDLMDFYFRLERSLGLKITRAAVEERFCDGWADEVGQFAADLLHVLGGPRRLIESAVAALFGRGR